MAHALVLLTRRPLLTHAYRHHRQKQLQETECIPTSCQCMSGLIKTNNIQLIPIFGSFQYASSIA